MFKFRAWIILFAAGFTLSACSLAEDITPPPGYRPPTEAAPVSTGPTYPLVAPNPGRGASLYAQHCVPCHGASGKGDGPQASRLSNPVAPIGTPGLARQSTPAQWFAIVSQGNFQKFMPGFAGILSAGERWDVLAYVYSLSSPAGQIAQGEEIYTQQCASCHGDQGKGDGPKATSLSTRPFDLTDQAKLSEVSLQSLYDVVTNGAQQVMPAFKGKLSDDQRWAVTSYLRTFTLGAGQPDLQAQAAVTPPAGSTQETTPQPAGTASGETLQAGGTQTAEGPAATGSAVATGVVTGKITNGSGGAVPGGLTVTLHGYDSMQETFTRTTLVQADGTYKFENVEMPSGRVFTASVEFNQTTFNSDIAHSSQTGAGPINLPIAIYDSTTDASSLNVDRMHVFFDFSTPQIVQVVELFMISNNGQRTVAGSHGQAVVNFDLPEGASNLQFQEGSIGGRYVQTPKGFGDTAGIAPGSGQHQVLYAYDMPYSGKLDLKLPIPLPVTAAIVMSPDPGIKIQGSQLQDSGQQNVQGMSFHAYSSSSLAAGQVLVVNISGLPGQGSNAATGGLIPGATNTELFIGLGALGLVLIFAGVWLTRRRRFKAQPAAEGAAPLDNEDADTLVDAIIALDEKYRGGEIPEEAYQQRRSELKSRLREKLG
ncbi:MAG TPA: c-type cytochrome [Anaerolineaceae bacterium]|nr:c-type cytochrome [Anaerolineaceae bacterium]